MYRVTVSQENFVPVKPIPPSSLSTLRFIDCKDRALFPHESRRVSVSTDARIHRVFPWLKNNHGLKKIFTSVRETTGKIFKLLRKFRISHGNRLNYANNYFVEKEKKKKHVSRRFFTISKISYNFFSLLLFVKLGLGFQDINIRDIL